MYKNVHINSTHNSPNQETKQMLNYRRMNIVWYTEMGWNSMYFTYIMWDERGNPQKYMLDDTLYNLQNQAALMECVHIKIPLQEVFLGSASAEESYLTSDDIPNYGAGYKGPHSTWDNSEELSQVQSAL